MRLITVTNDDPVDDELRDILSTFSKLSHSEQMVVLARFAFELTISAHVRALTNAVEFPERLRAVNEIQHTPLRAVACVQAIRAPAPATRTSGIVATSADSFCSQLLASHLRALCVCSSTVIEKNN
jgi:hypothetical protein